MTLALHTVTVTDPPSANEALEKLDSAGLLVLRCHKESLTAQQIDRFQKWALDGRCVWVQGTDLGDQFGFLSLRAINRNGVRVALHKCPPEARAGEASVLLAGLPDVLGTVTLPGGRFGIETRKIVGLVPVLECRVANGSAYAAAARPYGKGRAVFTTFEIDRQNPAASRLALNIKKYALTKPQDKAAP